jgi:hypothetical protein
MDFATTILLQSLLFPQVQFRMFKPNAARRAWVMLQTGEAFGRVAALLAQARQHADHMDDPERRGQLFQLADALTAEVFGLQVQLVRCWLAGLEGFTLDGAVPSVDDFIRCAPSALFQEAAQIIQAVTTAPDDAPSAVVPSAVVPITTTVQ